MSGDGQRPVIAVTGLALEARIASGPGVRAVAGGVDAQRLVAAVEDAVARGASGIISFGIAGALVRGLVPGAWIVGRGVITPAGYRRCDDGWTRALAARLPGARVDDLAASDAPLTDPAGKRALHAATSAAAVDTESAIAAEAAAVHGLPFAAFRVIADPVDCSLPPAACVPLRAGGAVDVTAVARSLARAPSQLPLLVRTAIDARAAFAALLRGRRLLGMRLGFDFRALERDVL